MAVDARVWKVENDAAPAGRAGSSEGQPADAPESVVHRRIRVAWVAGPETIWRLERTLQPLAIGLMDELVDLVVMCPRQADAGSLPGLPLEIVRYTWPSWLGLRRKAIESLAGELPSRKVELLHALDAGVAPLTGRLARSVGLEYLISSYSVGDGRRLGTLPKRAAGVLAATEPVRRDLLVHHVAAASRICRICPGLYQVRQASCFAAGQRAAAVVAGGQLDDFGAFEAVLRSFAEIVARGYDCALFVIGRGKAERRLRALAETLQLRPQLTFADRKRPSQLAGIFKGADLYISPCAPQQADMESLLAMAAGIPVLAAEGGGSDFLLDGRTALRFRPGDSVELTMKLVALLDDRPAARSLADNALAYLREHHSAAGMVAAVADVYRHAAGTR